MGQRPARRKRSAADAGSRNPALSSEARLRGCTKESLSSVGKSGSWHLLYLFGELYVIMVLRPCPPIYSGGEVRQMPSITTFMLSVAANVASYYICKWLDRCEENRKA